MPNVVVDLNVIISAAINLASIPGQALRLASSSDTMVASPEAALEGGAEAIVTGDRDLLDLDPWRGVRIYSASEYLASRRQPMV